MSLIVKDVSKYGWKPETLEKIKKHLFPGIIIEVDKGHFNTSLLIKLKKRLFSGMVSNKIIERMGLKNGDKVYVLIEPKTESFTIFKKD